MLITKNISENDIYEQIDLANEAINSGESKFRGMSYEDGVKTTLDWILGNSDNAKPMDN